MNKLILCEGETDAILLSYYLGKVAGWKFCKKPPADIAIKPDTFEQSANWYENGDDRLLICAMGGKDNVRAFFSNKILRLIVDAGAFPVLHWCLTGMKTRSRLSKIMHHLFSNR